MSSTQDFPALSQRLSPDSFAPPLSALVSATAPSTIGATNVFRRYTSTFSTSTKIRGKTDLQSSKILYEVGSKLVGKADWTAVMAPHPDPAHQISQVLPTNAIIKVELMDRHKKFSNFTGRFDYTDLSAMGRVLGKAVAKYTLTGTLTCEELRGGRELQLRAVNTRADPVSAGEGCVYIPRMAALDECVGSFGALVCAANNCGASVFSDVVEMDANHRVVLNAPTGANLAMGCVHAMRILLAMYQEMDAGAVMAYAITSGVHNLLSVVSHTDEGGLTRDAFRAVDFTPSFGGIFISDVRSYVGLPMPDVYSLQSFQSLVDSIAIGSAGLVALSDPLVDYEGRKYPTVFTARGSVQGVSGEEAEGTIETQVDLIGQIASEAYPFAVKYIDNLGRLFCVNGEVPLAAEHLALGFEMLSLASSSDLEDGAGEPTNRHLSMVTAAPWYWVEPTSLFTSQFCDSDAARAGFGPMVAVNEVKHEPMFEWTSVVAEGGTSMDVVHSWRSARTNALMVHLRLSKKDGLANMVPKQFSAQRFHMVGGTTGVDKLRDRGGDIRSYMWGRGQSPIPAPAEAIYLGKGIGSVCHLYAAGGEVLDCVATRFPDKLDLGSGTVKMSVSRPFGVANGAIMDFDKCVSRTRTQAARALARAREVLLACSSACVTRMEAGDFEPAVLSFDTSPVAGSMVAEGMRTNPVIQVPTVVRSQPVTHAIQDGPEHNRPAPPTASTHQTARTITPPPGLPGYGAAELAAIMEEAEGQHVEPAANRNLSVMQASDTEPMSPAAQ